MNAKAASKLQMDTARSLEVSNRVDAWHLAKTAIELAQELEATERRIKEEVLRAAIAGELTRVGDLITRWLKGPVCEVLATGAMAPSEANCATNGPQGPQTSHKPDETGTDQETA